MSDLSMIPKKKKSGNSVSLEPQTVKTLIGCAVALMILFAANWWVGGQNASAQKDLDSANAAGQQLKLQTAKVQSQIKQLQGAGGADKVELVTQLAKSRYDWEKLVLAVIKSSSPGITINNFSGSSTVPSGSNSSSGSSQNSIQIAGTAQSNTQLLNTFLPALRAQKVGNAPAFAQVSLGKVGDNKKFVDWSISLTLPPLPPAPSPGEAQ